MKAELGKEEEEEEEEEGLEERYFQGYDGIVSGTVLWMWRGLSDTNWQHRRVWNLHRGAAGGRIDTTLVKE